MGNYTAPLVDQWNVQIPPGVNDRGGDWKYPTIAVTNIPVADTGWSSTTGITDSDDSTSILWQLAGGPGRLSSYLYVSGFGLSIPASATILGIEARLKTGNIWAPAPESTEESVRLAWTTAAGVMSVDNKASGTSRATLTEYIYGSPTDLWGETTATLTPAVLNASDFGLVYRLNLTSNPSTIQLRALALRVTYSVVEDGAIRTTQAYAEVLVKKTEPVRVTQTYAEVLVKKTEPVRVTQVYAEVIRSIADVAGRPRRLIFLQGG